MPQGFCITAAPALCCEIHNVGETLEGIVDLMGQLVRHSSSGSGGGVLDQGLLLALLPYGHRGKVGERLHHAAVSRVKRLHPFVRHDPDCAASVIDLPWKQEAVGHNRGFDAHEIEEALRYTKELWPLTLQTDTAGAGRAGKACIEEVYVLA